MVTRWMFAALLLALPLGCAEQTVPAELLHVWRTSRPDYQDRYLEVRPDYLIFGTGGSSSVSERIERVEVERSGEGRFLCVIHYAGREGGEASVRLVFEPGTPARLHFENREEHWVREEDAAWLAKRG